MGKFSITREEQIPFREANGTIMQMKQYAISITVTQDEGESIDDIEKQLDIVFNRNLEKTLEKDSVYQRQKKQLNFLVTKLKEINPEKARDIILEAKKF